ncbi:phosphopyruvate hydratase [Candidatus Saccharibacteria bacterium]|nr:phosphopyruvate hydratase [Candidatus Saccharibacteria bacterium]
MEIQGVIARQVLDSRGNPTVEADVLLTNGAWGRAAVPSGASTGSGEALELRDGEKAYGGKGVLKAVHNITREIAPAIVGKDASKQAELDKIMIDLDGTENKARLGANAILAVSLAAAKATAAGRNQAFHQYIAELSGTKTQTLPLPMMNLVNGGAHADWGTDFQEYMVIPVGAKDIFQAVQMGAEVFHALKKVIADHGYATLTGDEGGYGPRVKNGNNEPLEMITEAIKAAGYQVGKDFGLGMDVAASEFYDKDGNYLLKTSGEHKSNSDLINWYTALRDQFGVISVEDGLGESDWNGWQDLTARLGQNLQIVGDDLLVTNVKLLQKAIEERACNAILIKPNQIGSLTETIEAVQLAQKNNFRVVMSHRSGETEDVTIAHLAVGLGCGQIKTGSLSRSDRVAKYNELFRIAEANPDLKLASPFA